MSKIKRAEEHVYVAMTAGEMEIDADGAIWRVATRRRDRWGGLPKSEPCQRKRADRVGTAGYLNVRAMVDGKRMTALAHRLVWFHLHGRIPDGMTVNHKNGVKSDNRPTNLELATDAEQQIHANQVLGTGPGANQDGEKNPFAKVTDAQVIEIRAARATGEYCSTIAKRYGITYQQVWRIGRGLSRSTG